MLFSSDEVANYINATFEPAWESLRPAPLVTIDFGNGHVVKRTLQGNVATYVCSAWGTVYDILPGIYAPAVYRRALETCNGVAEPVRPPPAPAPRGRAAARPQVRPDLSTRLRSYHAARAAQLRAMNPPANMRAIAQMGGGFKGGFGGAGGFGGIEGPTQRVVINRPAPAPEVPKATQPLAARPELALDAQVNEVIRRRHIHEYLARSGPVRPDEIKKWLFKEVLHTDLDDPMLGLGIVLNANYPFADEDRAAAKR